MGNLIYTGGWGAILVLYIGSILNQTDVNNHTRLVSNVNFQQHIYKIDC